MTDWLSHKEIRDVQQSLKEIESGKAKKFRDVDTFLAELKE